MDGHEPVARIVPVPDHFDEEAMRRFLANELRLYEIRRRRLLRHMQM